MRRLPSLTILETALTALLLGSLLPTPGLAQSRVDPRLVGEWMAQIAGSPVQMVFRIEANGQCGLDEDVGTCQAQGGVLVFKSKEGEERYNYQLQGGALTISGGDMDQPVVFRRIGEAEPSSPGGQSAPGAGNYPQPTEPEETPSAPAGGLAGLGAATGGRTAPSARSTQKKRPLTEAEVGQLLAGHVPSDRLIEVVEERGISFSVTPAVASRLKAKGAMNDVIAALRRAGGSQVATSGPAARLSGAGGLAALGGLSGGSSQQPARMPAARGGPAALRGPRHTQEQWGLSFAAPPGWQVFDRKVALILKSETDPGLMLIRFARKTGVDKLGQLYMQGLQEEGLQLMPATQPERFSPGGFEGVAGEMAGSSQDGTMLRARTIGVVSPFGDAAIILGLTSQADYAQMRARADALAASFSFTQPKTAPVKEFLAGRYQFIYVSSVGSYSREARLNLCNDGSFDKGGEMYGSGEAGSAATQHGSGGQWSAEGDESQGVVTFIYNNGQQAQLEYVVSTDPKDMSGYGPAVTFGNTKYQKAGDGSCQ